MTALAGSIAGIGGTSTRAAPMRLRARRPGLATLRSLAARTREVRPDVALPRVPLRVPPRVSPVGLEPREVTPDGDDPVEAREPFPVVSRPVRAEPDPEGEESGPVGRESSGPTDLGAVAGDAGAGCWADGAAGDAPAMRPHTVQ